MQIAILFYQLCPSVSLSWDRLIAPGYSGGGLPCHSSLMSGMATLPQSNQELLVAKEQSWKTPGELGVSKSMKCDIFPSATGKASGL